VVSLSEVAADLSENPRITCFLFLLLLGREKKSKANLAMKKAAEFLMT
jgi:hypothetical protein